MKWNLEQKLIVGGLCAALLLMGIISWISYQNAIQLIKSTERIKKTYTTLEYLAEVQATLNEAEAGRRGYLLFGTQVELERYNFAIARAFEILNALEQSLESRTSQKEHLQQLRSLIEERQKLYLKSNILFHLNPNELSPNHPMVIATSKNRTALQQVFVAIQSEEQSSLKIWIEHSNNDMQYRMAIENVGTMLSFTIFLIVYIVFYQQLLRRQKAERMQRKILQEKELSELKLEFLALVSHEFRTPLSVILGSAQLLKDNLENRVEQLQLRSLTRIESSAKSMKHMLADVLTIARADAGKLEYNPSWVELQSFCLNLVEDMQLSDRFQHTIKLIDLGNRTHGWLDEVSIYSVLSNLLSNAIKYSPIGSNIDFVLNGQVDMITFQIKDEGMGISSETQTILFEPFSRGANARGIVGTGLGLALVKRCLDLHQGKIMVDSHTGAGTTFTIHIPQPQSSPSQLSRDTIE
ncbi:ATP-binding protein [Tumidithrix elongata RA019]|uniref:histidine kinase n=1 Tax=Tumidithrix elongata BACA0141 TaxID=2716417 RepID=A0AAW9Q7H6_9CYAN|nr:ATP-binding protein [Tumidithrix elongata RA019]